MVFNIRIYRSDDLESIVALINAVDAFDGGEDGTTMEEAQAELSRPDLKPEENVFVAEEETGHLVGYANLRFVQDPAIS